MPTANFQQGQTIEEAFTMQPGKCYTIIAAGVGVQQIDATAAITTPMPGFQLPPFGSAQGKATPQGSQVVLGPKASCIKTVSPFPVQAKYVITAARGAGIVTAQLYVK